MNFVYPLGSGSLHDNLELKLSLRSIERHCKVGDVFIIGEKPLWLSHNAYYIPYPDRSKHNKDGNMIQKIVKYCEVGWTDSFFVRMSDDQIVLADDPDFTPYHCGKLSDKASMSGGDWHKRAFVTMKMLDDNGYPTWNYDTHAPVLMFKSFIEKATDRIDKYFAFYDRGYVINSLIYNMVNERPDPVPEKHVIRVLTADWIEPEGYTFLNFNDYGFTDKLQKWLLNRFPEPSRFEK